MGYPFRRTIILLPLLLFSTLFWGGCGASRSQMNMEAAPAPAAQAPAMSEPAEAAVGNTQYAQDQSTVSDGVPMQRQIIARANLELVVSDTQQVVDAITALMNAEGGFISNANLYRSNYGGDERLQGNIQLRVPAGKLERVLDKLSEMAVTVRSKNINREDVTDQYSDLDAQLRNLSATENELRELLAEVRAKPNAKPADILEVHNSLTSIRGQIEQIQGHKNLLDNMISLSTIDVTLTPDIIARPIVEEGWRPMVVIKDATRELVSAMQDLVDAGIWFVIYLLPILLVIGLFLGVVFGVARWIFRRIWRRPGKLAQTPSAN